MNASRPHTQAAAFASATGDAVAEKLILGKLLGILQIFECVDLAVRSGGEFSTRLQIGLEFSDLVEHLIDIGNQIALHRETRQGSELDDARSPAPTAFS